MSRKLAPSIILLAIVASTTFQAARQASALAVVSHSPNGEVAQMADANDVRVMFSEPMIAIGSAAVVGQPSWITMTPAQTGHWFWSGTRTLIFSPDPDTPFPYATRYSVRVDASAAGIAGHALGSPFEFDFTTPTVRLLQTQWYRRNSRFDEPAVLMLRFNQPVRPGDVVAHTRVHLAPHTWTPPVLQAEGRSRLEKTDPAGLAQFDEKVAAIDRIARSSDPVAVRLAESWDEKRYNWQRAPDRVVLETTTAPSPEARLAIEIDDTMPSPGGPATHAAQVNQQTLDRAFFIDKFGCTANCDPSGYNSIPLRSQVLASALARAVTVVDVTDAGAEVAVTSSGPPPYPTSTANSLVQAGFNRQPPMTTWVVRVDPSLQTADGQTLGYPFVGVISNGHESPFFSILGSVWESEGGPMLPLISRNMMDVNQWVAPAPASELVPMLIDLARSSAQSVPPVASTKHLLTITPDVTEAHGIDVRNLLSPSSTGLVWAGFSGGEHLPYGPRNPIGAYGSSIIQVTNLGISVKDSAASTLVFVTRLDNAAPIAGAHVSIVNDANQVLWTGTSNQNGVAMAPALPLRPASRSGYRPFDFIVTAEKDGDVAYVGSNWGNTVQPYGFSLSYRAGDGALLRGSVFTDRGAYRQGEEVNIKGVLRRDAADGVTPLASGTTLYVYVSDGRRQRIDYRTVVVNKWSSIEWTWRLPAEAALGEYWIAISTQPADASGMFPNNNNDVVNGRFLVAAYRRPDFRVDATMTADPPVLGATLHGVVDAKYLFGKALESQPVHWLVWRYAATSVPDAIRQKYQEATYAFGYMPELSGPNEPNVGEKSEMLDRNGRVDVPIQTKPDVDYAFRYQLNGDVTSVSAQHIANSTQMIVHPAEVYVGLKKPSMFVNVKDPARTAIVVSDLSGHAVADVAVTVSLAREEWFYGARPGVGGRGGASAASVWQRKETPAGEWTLRSAAAPVPLDIPLKDGGSYVLHATAVDASGRHTRTDARFYGIGGGMSSWRMDGNKITLVPERTTWKPGESAKVMIQSPWEHATALVTVEREGVRRYQQVSVSSTQDTVDVPITAGDVPNVFVSVLLVKGRTADALAPDGTDAGVPAFRVGYTTLTIDDESKRLNVSVSSDRDEYLPHALAKVSVAVRDPNGKPASAEVALWAVDYGLLSLTNYTTPDIVKAIYARRDLQVLTEDTRERMISRRALVKDDGGGQGQGSGRGGGGDVRAVMSEVTVTAAAPVALSSRGATGGTFNLEGGSITDLASRSPWAFNFDSFEQTPGAAPAFTFRKDFRPVVFWLGSTTTDVNGRATKDVTLPDSLTTYRIMAVADEAKLFGSGEREIKVTKPLTLLPAFPRFLSRGDHAVFGATVTNGSTTGGDAVVTVRSLDGAALGFEAATVKTLHLSAGETQAVRFDGIARSIAPVRVQMTVTLGGETDAFETTLPVTMPSRLETVAAYGDTTSKAVESLILPAGAVPGVGGLTINLASTALVGLGESLRYVNEYPYECAEAKASRALALVLTADLGGAFVLPGVKPETYRANAASALDALYGFQCGDGGFAFWPNRCEATSAYLTAYVIDVWHTSRDLKMTIDQGAINRALDYLQRQQRLQPPEVQWWPAWAASQAYAAKVMTEFGRDARADVARLYGVAERMPVFALSYLADALAGSGERGWYDDVVRRITNALRVEADRAHVEEMDDDSLVWLWSSNVRATAVVLEGLARRKDDGTLAAPMARWLMASRTNGRWGTTYENATALGALVSYYRTFESEVPQMTTTVKLGASPVGTTSFAGRNTTTHEFKIPMPELAKTIAGATRDLEVARTGTGRVYYTTRLRYLAPEPPDPVDRGMHIDRKFALFVPGADSSATSPSATTFTVGDVIRVTVTVNLSAEGKFLAVDDRMPAGFEPIDESLSTTALDLAREATTNGAGQNFIAWWRRGGFDHVEKHDDRVLAFATRLSAGRHEFTYLVRATTAGTFTAAGARAEAMYAPEVTGRSAAAVVTIK